MSQDFVRTSSSLARTFSVVIGLFLVVEGVWGFFSPVVFGALATNPLHAGIHVVLGFVAFWAAFYDHSRGFLTFLGLLLVAVAVLWFIPATTGIVTGLLNANENVAYVNLLVGAIAVIVGRTGTRRARLDTRAF